jgi:hypothetical protein
LVAFPPGERQQRRDAVVRVQLVREVRGFREGAIGVVCAVEVEEQLLEARDAVPVVVRVDREVTRRPRRVAAVDEAQERRAARAERPVGIADLAAF